jgi:hypothetical protein
VLSLAPDRKPFVRGRPAHLDASAIARSRSMERDPASGVNR